MNHFAELSYRWYSLLSQISNTLGQPIQGLLFSQSIPAVSALLLGILGGLAPCQLAANAGAIAYVAESAQGERRLWRTVRSFVLGKILVYTLLGFLASVLGWKLPVPMMAFLRKLSGPLLIAMGLSMVGWLKWRGSWGVAVTEWLRLRMPRAVSPAFGLGVAFSLGFCPTMAMIFFGWLVPLLLQTPAGLLLSVIFAVGTSLPLLLWAGVRALSHGVAKRWLRGARRADRFVRLGAAMILLLLGLSDTLLYWFM